jgi:ketosteroid isomerase-like protein
MVKEEMKMRWVRELACAAVLLAGGWSDAAPAASANDEALAPVRRFFDAFARRDKAGMLAEAVPNAELMSERDGELRRLTLEALADKIAAFTPGAAIAEPIDDPITLEDKTLAVVWAPYRFTIDGKTDHCGVDAITLLKLQGHWRIAAISDDRRDKCD